MASSDTLIYFDAKSAEPPNDSLFASLDTFESSAGHVIPVLDFDPGSSSERADFRGFMPNSYSGSGITVTIGWSTDATSGNALWGVAFKSVSDSADDLDTKGYAGNQAFSADAAPGAAGQVAYVSLDIADGSSMDSIAADEMFFMRVQRSSSAAGDTINSNDCELHFIAISEQ